MLTTNLPRQPHTPHMRKHIDKPRVTNHMRACLSASSPSDREEIASAFGQVTAWRMALKQAEAAHSNLLLRHMATPLPANTPIDNSARRERNARVMHAELMVLNAQAQLDAALALSDKTV